MYIPYPMFLFPADFRRSFGIGEEVESAVVTYGYEYVFCTSRVPWQVWEPPKVHTCR